MKTPQENKSEFIKAVEQIPEHLFHRFHITSLVDIDYLTGEEVELVGFRIILGREGIPRMRPLPRISIADVFTDEQEDIL